MPSASDLDETVEVLAKSTTTNSIGETETTYSVDRTVPAGVEILVGSENRVAGRDEESATVRVRMREDAASGLTRGSRLRYKGDDLQVHALREMGRRKRFVEIETSRVRT